MNPWEIVVVEYTRYIRNYLDIKAIMFFNLIVQSISLIHYITDTNNGVIQNSQSEKHVLFIFKIVQ